MQVKFDMRTNGSLSRFDARCEVAINRVGNGSRKALLAACEAISEESLNQVPRDTGTLASSQFYEITGHYKTGWEAVIGYGKPNYTNPKTGESVIQYMLAVHENLRAKHPVGKAKFLEDPLRAYVQEKHPRTIMRYVEEALRTK